MYQLVVFLHVLAAFIFFMAHGASVMVSFKLRGERELERIKSLLELSTYSLSVGYMSLLVLLGTGIIAGFMGEWWGYLWIWAALGLLITLIIAMYLLGTLHFGKIRKAVGLPYQEGMKYDNPPLPPASAEELDALLSSLSSRPILLVAVGVGGLVVILWLMMFKPF